MKAHRCGLWDVAPWKIAVFAMVAGQFGILLYKLLGLLGL